LSFAQYPSLDGAIVFVTGGASGIGQDMVRAFCAQKSHVGFVDIDEKGGRALADELTGGGAKVRFEACDLRDIDALRSAFAGLKSALGPASVLVNNAARDDRHGWQEVTPDYYDERIATNLRHMFFAIQTVAPDMIAAGKGSIINFGSNSWFEASGGMPVYTTAKAAVHGMTRSRQASHPRQYDRAGLGDDRAAKGPMGQARGDRPPPRPAMPARPDRSRLSRADGAVPRLRRFGDVHGE
jgi:D-xylose 1-dehydrogenase